MRLIADVPTVAWRGYRVAHIPSDPGQIWVLRNRRGSTSDWWTIDVACHNGAYEHHDSWGGLMVDPDLPLCRKCVKAYVSSVGAVILDGEGTFKRGSRSDMGGLDQILARVYDRFRKQDQRWTIERDRTALVGEVLDTIREELL